MATETYAKNLEDIEALDSELASIPTEVTGNAITFVANDHAEVDDGPGAPMYIKNHDYILAAAPGIGPNSVKEAYEEFDAIERAKIAYNKDQESEGEGEPEK